MNSSSMPVDIPQQTEVQYDYDDSILEIGVSAEDKYVLNGENHEYEDVLPLIEGWIDSTRMETQKMKISGDKLAHYEAVFKLIAFCKANQLSPILVFKNED